VLVARLVHVVAAVLWPMAALAGVWSARRLERKRTRRRVYLLVGLGFTVGIHNLVLALTVAQSLRLVHMAAIILLDIAGIVALFLNASYGEQLVRDEELLHVLARRHAGRGGPAARRTRSPLSSREIEVLWLLCRGMSPEQIASDLYLSTNTVDTHIRNLRRKLGASSRVEAVGWAIEAGIYDPGTGRMDLAALARLQGQWVEADVPARRWRRPGRLRLAWALLWPRTGPRTTGM
jgi:DNA-binding CsgD family transcriptional regulator